MVSQDELSQLEAILADPDFIALTSRTSTLNVFEAVGATHQELRHSNFLAFLLDPTEPHGLDEVFLRNFLTSVAGANLPLDAPLSSLDVRLRDLGAVEVRREWEHVDLLLVEPSDGWVCAIENKVRSTEGEGQLDKYQEVIEAEYSDFDVLFIYLTPDGEEPSNDAYVAASYEAVLHALEAALEERRDTLSDKAIQVLDDYAEIVRRYVLMESEIADICRRIYRKHKTAVNLIVEHIPSPLDEAKEYVRERIPQLCQEFGLVEDDHTRSLVRFWLEQVDGEALRAGEGWTSSGRILLFEIDMRGNAIELKMVLGRGDQATRRKIFDWAKQQSPPFKQQLGDDPGSNWKKLYHRTLFTEAELEDLLLEEGRDAAMEAVEEALRETFEQDLPAIAEAFESSDWC